MDVRIYNDILQKVKDKQHEIYKHTTGYSKNQQLHPDSNYKIMTKTTGKEETVKIDRKKKAENKTRE